MLARRIWRGLGPRPLPFVRLNRCVGFPIRFYFVGTFEMHFLARIAIGKTDTDWWRNMLMNGVGARIPGLDRQIGRDIKLGDTL